MIEQRIRGFCWWRGFVRGSHALGCCGEEPEPPTTYHYQIPSALRLPPPLRVKPRDLSGERVEVVLMRWPSFGAVAPAGGWALPILLYGVSSSSSSSSIVVVVVVVVVVSTSASIAMGMGMGMGSRISHKETRDWEGRSRVHSHGRTPSLPPLGNQSIMDDEYVMYYCRGYTTRGRGATSCPAVMLRTESIPKILIMITGPSATV